MQAILRPPVVVSLVLLLVFLFQVVYLGPWLLDLKHGSLSRLVGGFADDWMGGMDITGFAPPAGSRIAFIPTDSNWTIPMNNADRIVTLMGIGERDDPDWIGWRKTENSTRKHALLKAIATEDLPTDIPISPQYVYLKTRRLGYARPAERTESEKGWFVAEIQLPSSFRSSLAANLFLLALSLSFAISAFVVSDRESLPNDGHTEFVADFSANQSA